MERIDIEVPVRGEMAADSHLGALQTVRMRSIDEQDAPLVIQWDADWRSRSYRAFEGRLFERMMVVGKLNTVVLGDLRPQRGGSWGNLEESSPDLTALLDFPFPASHANGRREYAPPRFLKDVSGMPDLQEVMDRTRQEMEACIVIGDDVWMPSPGPVCRVTQKIKKKRDLAEFHVGSPVAAPGRHPASLSCLAMDAFVEECRATFGGVNIAFNPPAVLSQEGWQLEHVIAQQDTAIWREAKDTIARTARGLNIGDLSRDVVAAFVALEQIEDDADPAAGAILAHRLAQALEEVGGDLVDPYSRFGIAAWGALSKVVAERKLDTNYSMRSPEELDGFSL